MQKDKKEMTIEELCEAAKKYDNKFNEGREGYNPYDDAIRIKLNEM